ncbi:MAG: protein kinase [Deltaproteobacteria bacterium]|nr:protein kinase [Deltaproteobacteria bacterium]
MNCIGCNNEIPDKARFCPKCGLNLRPQQNDEFIGNKIEERYLILELLGEGGSGKVYLARHVNLGKRVAVKILHKELSQNEKAVYRFRKEALSVTELNNEHIINIIDFGTTPDGVHYLVMELLDGETLSSRLTATNRLSFSQTFSIINQLCEALKEPHALGYIHRDLRPRNLMLIKNKDNSEEDFVKILDFGLAKIITGEKDPSKSGIGLTIGDPTYTAPEQMKAAKVDARTDIYSIGVIAYHCLAGYPPYNGNNVFEIMGAHFDAPYPPIENKIPNLPKGIDAILLKSLAKDPKDRFPTVLQFSNQLKTLLNVSSGKHQIKEEKINKNISYLNLNKPFVSNQFSNVARGPGGGVVDTSTLQPEELRKQQESSQKSAKKMVKNHSRKDVIINMKSPSPSMIDQAKEKLSSGTKSIKQTNKEPENKDKEIEDAPPGASLLAAAPSETFLAREKIEVDKIKKEKSRELLFWFGLVAGGLLLAFLIYGAVLLFTEEDEEINYEKYDKSKSISEDKSNKSATKNKMKKSEVEPKAPTQDSTKIKEQTKPEDPKLTDNNTENKNNIIAKNDKSSNYTSKNSDKSNKSATKNKSSKKKKDKKDKKKSASDFTEKYNEGSQLLNQGKINQAYRLLKNLYSTNSSSYSLNMKLASISFELGKVKESEKYLKKAVTLRSSARAWYKLGNIRLKLNKKSQAKKAYKKALQIKPNYNLAKKALARMN